MPYLMPGPEWAQYVAWPLVVVGGTAALGYVYLWNKERKEKKLKINNCNDMIPTKGTFRNL